MKLTKTYYPSSDLSKYILNYNFYKITVDTKSSFMIPEGVIELIFQFDTSIWQREWNSSNWNERPNGFVGGLHKKSFYLKTYGRGKLFSIRFLPGSFSFFTGQPVNNFQNKIIPIEEIWDNEDCATITQQIAEAPTPKKCIEYLERFLRIQYFPHKYGHMCHAALYLSNPEKYLTIETLSKKYNLSRPRFRALFGQVVGCSPKQYQQTRRINTIINQYNVVGSLTGMAFDHGYFDQAHFTHDFKSVTGLTPSKFSKDLLLHDPVHIKS